MNADIKGERQELSFTDAADFLFPCASLKKDWSSICCFHSRPSILLPFLFSFSLTYGQIWGRQFPSLFGFPGFQYVVAWSFINVKFPLLTVIKIKKEEKLLTYRALTLSPALQLEKSHSLHEIRLPGSFQNLLYRLRKMNIVWLCLPTGMDFYLVFSSPPIYTWYLWLLKDSFWLSQHCHCFVSHAVSSFFFVY